MADLLQSQPEPQPSAESFGIIPNTSEPFGTVRNTSETFRSVPKASAPFRTMPKASERTADHTLTVKEVAKLFEAAGVSRTERSIVNWCLPNKHDVARLDSVFDANERKWFITRESVDRAIAEEQSRAVRRYEPLPNLAEDSVPNESEQAPTHNSDLDDKDKTELRGKLRDLEITNRVKDAYIQQLKGNLESADEERRGYIQQLIEKSHQIGSLETQLRQLSAPTRKDKLPFPNRSEGISDGYSEG